MQVHIIPSSGVRISRTPSGWLATAVLVLFACAPMTAKAQSPCPPPDDVRIDPVPDLTVPAATLVPDDACLPNPDPDPHQRRKPLAYFDHYAWRAFIALVWPAATGQRGVPDRTKKLERVGQTGVPTVFETFKADWETFQEGTAPSAWNEYHALMTSGEGPCQMARPGDFLLAPVSKYGTNHNIAQFGMGNVTTVLVSQNRRFVRYLGAYNEKLFNHILGRQLYLLENVTGQEISFPVGSISVKSSWVDLTNIPNRERFHRREAWLVDPLSGACKKTVMGLVGLHIVQKTLRRPQWIWTTFEHGDNVPPPDYVRPLPPAKPKRTFTFNDGTNVLMPPPVPEEYKFASAVMAHSPPRPININRLKPINSDMDVSRNTMETNYIWRQALRAQNSVWQNYQLTMTQWPTLVRRPDVPGDPGHTTPGFGAPGDHSAFANTTLETWPQTDINRGCMACHNIVRTNDFVWALLKNAFSRARPFDQPEPAIDALKSLLREGLQ